MGVDQTQGGSAVPETAPAVARRRLCWPWLVLLIVAGVVGLCAVPAGVWLAMATVKASEGAKSPGAAVQEVLSALGRDGAEMNVDRYLCPEDAERLRRELAEMRVRFVADAEDSMYRVKAENFNVVKSGSTAAVTVEVALSWTVTVNGSILFQDSEARPWTFRTREASWPGQGWTVCGFDAPDVCAYVRC